jgi:hypothetical protein
MTPTNDAWDLAEYDDAAEWCAKRGWKGRAGDPLPPLLSDAVYIEIREHPEEFQERVRATAYALAMHAHPISVVIPDGGFP